METHIFVPSSKKDILYCKKCQKLSYKGVISQSLQINFSIKLNMDPLSLKFVPFSKVTNYNLDNHVKYIQNKNIGISNIIYLINRFGLNSMILYKAISLMDQIYLENDVLIDNIKTISTICIFLVIQFNECCKIYNNNDYFNKNEIIFHSFFGNNKLNQNKPNINGFFQYIKNNVNNFSYWEVLCIKYLNYDLRKSSAYDYLLLFFRLGIFFCEEKIDVNNKFNICLQILDYIINDSKACNFSQYILAMSIIKVAFEFEKNFDKNIFKVIYGVDLYKKKYIDCSNMIKNILSLKIQNEINYNNYYYILNNIYQNNFIKNFPYITNIINNTEIFFYLSQLQINKNKNEEEKKDNINYINTSPKFFIDSYINQEGNKKFNFGIFDIKNNIVNNNKIINNNNFMSKGLFSYN